MHLLWNDWQSEKRALMPYKIGLDKSAHVLLCRPLTEPEDTVIHINEQRKTWSVCADVQADLGLRCSQITPEQKLFFQPKCTLIFSNQIVLLFFPTKVYSYFFYVSTKIHPVCTHLKCLTEVLLMSTHNVCFCGEIRKIPFYLQLCHIQHKCPFLMQII